MYENVWPKEGSPPSGKVSVVRWMSPLVSCVIAMPNAPLPPAGITPPMNVCFTPELPYRLAILTAAMGPSASAMPAGFQYSAVAPSAMDV